MQYLGVHRQFMEVNNSYLPQYKNSFPFFDLVQWSWIFHRHVDKLVGLSFSADISSRRLFDTMRSNPV